MSVIAHGAGREYVPHELTGAERERGFQSAAAINPGWLRYRAWAGEREIPVIRLDPAEGSRTEG